MTIVIRGGQVVDPRTRSERVADVLVVDGFVQEIAPDLDVPDGASIIDATGLVVGPGFVDLHSHAQTISGQRLQALDGVTTALDLEAGLMPVSVAYTNALNEGRHLNFGYSASWSSARASVLTGAVATATFSDTANVLNDPRWQRSSSERELRTWLDMLESELAVGALGIGVLLGYAPKSDPREFLEVAHLAARVGATTFTHVRELVEFDQLTPVDGSTEIAIAASETGAAMHHCHVNSTSRQHVDRVLQVLDSARSNGSRVTLEAYPYGAGSTSIGAYFLDPDRLASWGLAPSKVVVLATGERLADVRRLNQLRADDPGAACIVEFLDETDPTERAILDRGLEYPDAIVASDAMPVVLDSGEVDTQIWPIPPSATTHPRTAGTFAKTVRLMVRETKRWDWIEAFRRCSYLPARVLDATAPSMRGKGHLAIGSDADLIVVDPTAMTDNATYFHPTRPSFGVRYSLVNGQRVVDAGELVLDSFPGRAIRGVGGI